VVPVLELYRNKSGPLVLMKLMGWSTGHAVVGFQNAHESFIGLSWTLFTSAIHYRPDGPCGAEVVITACYDRNNFHIMLLTQKTRAILVSIAIYPPRHDQYLCVLDTSSPWYWPERKYVPGMKHEHRQAIKRNISRPLRL
jgi:hypothetical protein